MKMSSSRSPGAGRSRLDPNPGSRLQLELTDAIRCGTLRPGHCIPSLRELSERYQITFDVVRGVVRNLEQRGLVEKRHGSGTYVAEPTAIPRKPANGVASSRLVVGMHLRSGEHIFGKISSLLEDYLHVNHGTILSMPTSNPFDSAVMQRWLEDHRDLVPAAVVTRLMATSLRQFHALLPESVRRITILRGPSIDLPPKWHSVDVDVEAGSRLMITHLLKRGHKRVGYITHARTVRPQRPETWRKRLVGHTPWIVSMGNVLRDHGLHGAFSICYGPRYDFDKPLETDDSLMSESNLNHLQTWLSRPDRPTAIIGEDFRLYCAKIVAVRMGLRVPEDLELIGMGNTPYSLACGFSSLSYDEPELARQVSLLILNDETNIDREPRHLTVKPNLILR